MELTINITNKKAYEAFLKFLKSIGIKNASKEFAKKQDKVLINIDLDSENKEYEKEHKEFIESSMIVLGMKYDDEPDISHVIVKEPNPTFNLNA